MEKNIFFNDRMALPISNNSSFESFFCIASMSSKDLKEWSENHLHPKEAEEYANIANSRMKYDYLLRSYCVKQAILQCLGKNVNYARNVYPYNHLTSQTILTSDRLYYSRLQVNITHAKTLGFAIAFEGLYPFGVDAEEITSDKSLSVMRYLSSHENTLTKDGNKEALITALWTARESLCKALGGGISTFSDVTEVSDIVSHDNYQEISFTHFPDYKAYSFLLNSYILTISFPHHRRLQADAKKMWENINNSFLIH